MSNPAPFLEGRRKINVLIGLPLLFSDTELLRVQIRGALATSRGSDPERAGAAASGGRRNLGRQLIPIAPPSDQDAEEATLAALRRQMSSACTCGRDEEPTIRGHGHERSLSAASTSFSSPDASPALSSTSTNYMPASNKLSSESIPFAVPDFGKLSSFSSTSSYESFFHIEASSSDLVAGCEFLDFEPPPTTTAPGVQTMMMSPKPEGGGGYDPKRLPSSMFRTRSTTGGGGGEWSVSSNDSLFSIQLSNSADHLNAVYADLYYDAAGFPRFPYMGRDATAVLMKKMASMSESSSVRSGGLCVRHDCARCSGSGGKTRKSVRFAAATESVSTEGKHSVVVSTCVMTPSIGLLLDGFF
ncbi:hypothetical protein HU200_019453 [Digitaria exilis]|uniref:Uncharacterized protein n=1 Tax=Digitaria exilis TaxID=1010633 RepID=A0A835F393_9POAL|nr:hypothetical protein HU200_019453 [Digitaria exilis]